MREGIGMEGRPRRHGGGDYLVHDSEGEAQRKVDGIAGLLTPEEQAGNPRRRGDDR